MVKIYFLFILFFVGCGNKNVSFVDIISEASFGTKNNRIQFHEKGEYLKYSPNVGTYDNISGATYVLQSSESNIFIYQTDSSTLKVIVKDTNTVEVEEDTITNIFTPRGINLGKRPL